MYIIEEEAKLLAPKLVPYLTTMLGGSHDSAGDLAKTEDSIGIALDRVRCEMVNAALEATSESVPDKWACPICKKRLVAWKERIRTVVTCHGEGRLRVMRYRCRSCRKDYYPFQVLIDLCGTHFTIGARDLIAREAAEDAFGKASSRLAKLGVPVSASEVEQIADEVGRMRKEEEEIVRIHLHTRNQDLPLPLYQWQEWNAPAESAPHAVLSVDGAKVRSDEVGPDGVKWFEDSRFSRRPHQVRFLFADLRRAILFWADADLESIRLLDSFPMPLCACYRIRQSTLPINSSTSGYNDSKQCWYFGLRPDLLMTASGFIEDIVLSPGNCNDTRFLANYLDQRVEQDTVPTGQYWTMDKGYVNKSIAKWAKEKLQLILLARQRDKAGQPTSLCQRLIDKTRKPIEGVISTLTEYFDIEHILVRTDVGLFRRVQAKASAFSLARYFNLVLGREPMNIAAYAV